MSRSRRPSSREQRRAPIIYPSFPLPSLSAHAAHEWPRSGAPASLDDCCIALARPTRRAAPGVSLAGGVVRHPPS